MKLHMSIIAAGTLACIYSGCAGSANMIGHPPGPSDGTSASAEPTILPTATVNAGGIPLDEAAACVKAGESLDRESYCKVNENGVRVCQWIYVSLTDASQVFHQIENPECDGDDKNEPLTCAAAATRFHS